MVQGNGQQFPPVQWFSGEINGDVDRKDTSSTSMSRRGM